MSTALRGLSQCFLPDRSDARRRSREIDAMLKRDRQIPVVILMAGFNKSGKTTFFKQMRLINGAEYNQREVLEFREAIYDNIMKYESVKYFCDNIHRIGQLTFFTALSLDNRIFFFIIGCSDYDQTDFEDNYLVGTLNTFECFCKNGFFRNCPFILFFNKMDLLAEKVQTADIQKHFPEFQGDPHRLEDVQEFLVQSFEKRKWDDSRQIFYHMTTAVDTENFQKMFESVKDTIMGLILKNISLL
ncbi:guanine nucleotide-binding subunit alpha-12 isoform X1 [Labeo rohita]|uniref:Guanine nucleotide-binding subunit alpha-12 isoform X1 n=1 Tax=Labeo rohita TaxID=84645 RepID=A0A498LC22_LABRO|nr:guanine nucleotide-binding subunit alpha-12 isoform X1 [Labeo rohita]